MRRLMVCLCLLALPVAAEAGETITKRSALTGRLVAPVAVRQLPAGTIQHRLQTETQWSGLPVRLLILEQEYSAGRLWYRVRLPVRPNNSSGWIPADYVQTSRTPWRMVVNRRLRRATVFRSGKKVRRFRVVIGKQSTPTPRGFHAVWEVAKQPNPRAFLGPYALHLTAHSNVLKNYGGGPGRIGIHGRAGASLRDPLGSARSHGCVRVNNTDVRWVARRFHAGTPVEIR